LDAPGAGGETLEHLGLGGPDPDVALTSLVRARQLSTRRVCLPEILDAFGVRSATELVLMGHAASLTDQFWYRAPGSAARWEDVNFHDNDWDDTFRTSVLTGDYAALAKCSPDVPDVTTVGHLRKAWERSDEGILLLKEAQREDGSDLEGALLAAGLSALLFGSDAYQRLDVVERYGRRWSASPLMLSRDEELVQGRRLFAMCGIPPQEMAGYEGSASPQVLVDIFSRAGVEDASAHTAKIFAFMSLALQADLHAGNYGVIRNLQTDARRAAPLFDYDRSFGHGPDDFPVERMCDNPRLAMLLCAYAFSNLDPSWDWGWYDPRVLEGFERRIVEAYAPYRDLPNGLAALVARLFVAQRAYVDKVASEWRGAHGSDGDPEASRRAEAGEAAGA
jgi:hypothetical protein